MSPQTGTKASKDDENPWFAQKQINKQLYRGRWRKLGASRTGIFMNTGCFLDPVNTGEYTITIIRRWISKPSNCQVVTRDD